LNPWRVHLARLAAINWERSLRAHTLLLASESLIISAFGVARPDRVAGQVITGKGFPGAEGHDDCSGDIYHVEFIGL